MSSPDNRLRQRFSSENISPQGRVTQQQPIASASQMPASSFGRSTSSQLAPAQHKKQYDTLFEHAREVESEEKALLLASPQYIKQFTTLLEHVREVHKEERELWRTERAELQEKINVLEASLSRLSGNNNAGATGAEVWLGSKPDIQPTRTFSDTSNQPTKPDSRLPSIAEDVADRNRGIENEDSKNRDKQGAPHKPSIGGVQIDKNLDGINFKPSGLPLGLVMTVMTPQSPSPQSPSPSHVSPRTIQLPGTAQDPPDDPYTRHAGHTPLARRYALDNDGAASDPTTPTQPDVDRPPEPPASVRIPSERSDSYFSGIAPVTDPTEDDVALTGQLGLTNDDPQDKQFLESLDSKLSQAAESDDHAPAAVAGASEAPSQGDGTRQVTQKDLGFEQPEEEPRLKIKRSMNFGSAFGDRNPGKDF